MSCTRILIGASIFMQNTEAELTTSVLLFDGNALDLYILDIRIPADYIRSNLFASVLDE